MTRLRRARLARGLTVRELAERSRVSPGFTSMLENGYRPPRAIETLERVADALDLSPSSSGPSPFPTIAFPRS